MTDYDSEPEQASSISSSAVMNAWRFFKCVDCKDLSVNLRTTHKNPGQQCKAVEVFSLEKNIYLTAQK